MTGMFMASSCLRITIEPEVDATLSGIHALREVARRVYRGERVPMRQATSLVLCTDETIRALNARYRRKDRVTDVLSFHFGEPDLLGEIYMAFPRVAEQAAQYGLTTAQELERLLIHGLIHLLGHDHENPTARRRMECIERKYTAHL